MRTWASWSRCSYEEGLQDNTIVIFLTDNGTTFGDVIFNAGMRGKKESLYEGGHRVPFFIRWPAGGLRSPGNIGEPCAGTGRTAYADRARRAAESRRNNI